MTIEEIKELIRVVHETGIAELELQRGENRVRIRSGFGVSQEVVLHHPEAASIIGAAGPGPAVPAAAQPSPAREDEKDVLVKSPIVGTYYDAPSPGAPTFVKVGDQVEPGKVLCIIESMKLMNEIEAEIAGVVVAKLVENGRPVEYGEALFTIRPR
jgi:acetyl-CoA carboxylase biotin carboxyl carrier protein